MTGASPRCFPAGPLDPVVHAMASMGDMVLHAVVDVPPGLETSRLARALTFLAHSDPVVGARFQAACLRSSWTVDVDPAWEILDHGPVSSEEADRILERSLGEPFPVERPLPVDLRILRLENRDRLLVRVSHALADGGGTKRLLYGMARASRRLLADPEALPEALPFASRRPWRLLGALRHLSLLAMLRGVSEENRDLWGGPYLALPFTADGRISPPRLLDLRLPSHVMEPLRERWRPRGVTVNDLLLCALSRSLETHFEAPPGVGVGFITTADFRNLLPPEDLVCNLSGLRGLALGVSPLPPPETHLMAVQARTRRWKATGRGLLAALMGLALASILPDGLVRRAVRRRLEALGRSSRGMHIGFTNLGLLDARRLDFGQGPALDAFIVAPVVRPPLLVIAASGCAGHIHVSLGFHEPALPSERVRVLLDGVLRELHALSGGHPGAV